MEIFVVQKSFAITCPAEGRDGVEVTFRARRGEHLIKIDGGAHWSEVCGSFGQVQLTNVSWLPFVKPFVSEPTLCSAID